MSNSSGILVEWAVVDGRVAPISEFIGFKRGDRPYSECEVCRCRVIMRLGRRRAHHFAHYRGAACPLTARESALHYNSVRALANTLRKSHRLYICASCTARDDRRCTGTVIAKAAEDWDDVQVEVGLMQTRPDITLLRGGFPILAIEVRASNAVTQDKAAALAEVPMPWIEELAGTDCSEWSESVPLGVSDHDRVIADGRCETHASRAGLVREAHDAIRTPPSTDPEDKQSAWKFRIVDWYPFDRPRYRHLYWMYRRDHPEGFCELLIINHAAERPIVVTARGASVAAAFERASQKFDLFLGRTGMLCDSPMEWQDAASLARSTAMYDKTRFPPRYSRDDLDGVWQLKDDYARVQWRPQETLREPLTL